MNTPRNPRQVRYLGIIFLAVTLAEVLIAFIDAREVRLLVAIVVGLLALVAVFWVTPKLK